MQGVGGNCAGQGGGYGGVVSSIAIDAGVGRVVRFAQGDKPDGRIQQIPAAVGGGAHIEDGKAGGAGHPKAFAGQRLPHPVQLRRAVGNMKVFQPVGGQVRLAGAQAECAFLRYAVNCYVAGAAIAGDMMRVGELAAAGLSLYQVNHSSVSSNFAVM